MKKACFCCGREVPDQAAVCPYCGLNIEKIIKLLGDFLSNSSLAGKTAHTIAGPDLREITKEEFHRRVQEEWELVQTLLRKYQTVEIAALSQETKALLEALEIYARSLLILIEQTTEKIGERSVKLERVQILIGNRYAPLF